MSAEKIRKQQPLQQPEKQKQVKVKVHKKKWISTGEKFLYSFSTAAVLAASVFLVHTSAETDAINRDIRSLEQDIQQQQSQNENLAYQVKELSNPDRILSIAKENGLNIQNAQVKQAGKINNE
ncbi:cell division protein FtsL [Halobacillus karajensis]|uniref:Cell division protein FtsL n=1 Tax=Halobacillus karajensis TaxID=195088 RepID=A0A024P3V6_9BACI|nr:cell division protein FtsL [Halobacillus karajensis]CDQ19847.1 Cell division protein FtsL [Halobacillus karajensis]CDQ22307.1 Cell division protein FtsL [Halobacillus karajensis]CDQ28148.1 Cell division protein FtsL [Halobacillus karajensis]SEH71127.1 cell division protein FtsL [Halobacillus karajensis]